MKQTGNGPPLRGLAAGVVRGHGGIGPPTGVLQFNQESPLRGERLRRTDPEGVGGTPPSVIGQEVDHGGLEDFLQAAGGNPVGLDGIPPVDAGKDGLIRGKTKGTVACPHGVPQTAEPFGECVEGPRPEIKQRPLAGLVGFGGTDMKQPPVAVIIKRQVAGVDGRDFGNP